MNRRAVALMAQMRAEFETPRSPMVISGNIGPQGDGYRPGAMMSANEAQDYHAAQINVFRDTERILSAPSRSTTPTRRSAWHAPPRPPGCLW